jgi:predicted adenylyl cyclase CyaB
MKVANYEFKARATDLEGLEQKLKLLNPQFKGEDHQIDTYFNIPSGRLKLREGNIENALIYYERENSLGAKQSSVLLYKHNPDKSLKEILEKLFGIKVIVDKIRRIYFIDNVKFHFDIVEGLGSFIEVEAIDETGIIGLETLKEQCNRYFRYFSLGLADFVDRSYSDLMLDK